MKNILIKPPILICCLFLLLPGCNHKEEEEEQPKVHFNLQTIKNIKEFLEQCPTDDSVYVQIRKDFIIRKNGVLVGEISCSEPISEIPVEEYTDELILVQALRTIYYMDMGRTGHLSWTKGTLYDWMKSRIGGFDIWDTGDGGGSCCGIYDDRPYVGLGTQNDFNRDFDRSWTGIAGNIDLYVHEVRHLEAGSHSSCCGILSGCDSLFDELNPSCYAVQWILNKMWLTGEINVGISCLPEDEKSEIIAWHYTSCELYSSRFCAKLPPVLTVPDTAGGRCTE